MIYTLGLLLMNSHAGVRLEKTCLLIVSFLFQVASSQFDGLCDMQAEDKILLRQ